jgi:hypothetical protein
MPAPVSKFAKASLRAVRIRMAFCGPSKSGKTWESLLVADGMLKTLQEGGNLQGNGRIALIDTEDRSASKYADDFDFDVIEIDEFSPEVYIEWINNAAKEKYSALILDSISHEWAGKKGILEYHQVQASYAGVNSYSAWARATPKHNAFIEALIRYPGHVFATVRAKSEYAMEKDDTGKTIIRELGLGPIQRDSTVYEFDIWANVAEDHSLRIKGSRCRYLSDKTYLPEEVKFIGPVLARWISETIHLNLPVANPKISEEVIAELKELGDQLGMKEFNWYQTLASFGVAQFGSLEPEQAGRIRTKLESELSKKRGRQPGGNSKS